MNDLYEKEFKNLKENDDDDGEIKLESVNSNKFFISEDEKYIF